MSKQSGTIPPELSYQTFTVTVSGGTGSFTFSPAVSGKCYHRQVNVPNGAGQYTFYVSNAASIVHDIHTVTGFSDVDDVAVWVNETTFAIANANGDGDYTVVVWIGP